MVYFLLDGRSIPCFRALFALFPLPHPFRQRIENFSPSYLLFRQRIICLHTSPRIASVTLVMLPYVSEHCADDVLPILPIALHDFILLFPREPHQQIKMKPWIESFSPAYLLFQQWNFLLDSLRIITNCIQIEYLIPQPATVAIPVPISVRSLRSWLPSSRGDGCLASQRS